MQQKGAQPWRKTLEDPIAIGTGQKVKFRVGIAVQKGLHGRCDHHHIPHPPYTDNQYFQHVDIYRCKVAPVANMAIPALFH